MKARWAAIGAAALAMAVPIALAETTALGTYVTTTTGAATTQPATTATPTTATTAPPTTQPATTATTAASTTTVVINTVVAPTTTVPGVTTTTTSGVTTTTSGATTTIAGKKVFVCKYEGTPGVDERLQSGQNPISVDYKPGREPGGYFNDAQGRSYVLEYDTGQDEPDPSECPPPDTGGTTTTSAPGTTTTSPTTTSTTAPATTTSTTAPTTSSTTSTTSSSTSTTLPTVSLFAIEVIPTCPDGTLPEIAITFGVRPDLDGLTGTLSFSTGGSIPLVFNSGGTTDIAYPTSAGTGPVTMTYTLGAESVTRSTTFPEACEPATTTTSIGTTTSTAAPTTTSPSGSTSTTSSSSSTTTTLPETFTFGAAGTVCVNEVPTIRIEFQNLFPSLAGETGTLTFRNVNAIVVGSQELVYEPGTTVDILYPGTQINPDGSVADVPGWNLNADGFWVLDPSDELLREGIFLTYEVNPTAGPVLVTYPPESSECANPPGPFPPGPFPPGPTTTVVVLPVTE